MPDITVHLRDTNNVGLEIHNWIDELANIGSEFNKFHRKYRHHKEGIEEAVKLFGEQAREIATIHILKDCGHIPNKIDYETGKVNREGKDFPECEEVINGK